VRSYPANLGYNMYGVVTRGNWLPLAVGAGLTGGALLLDDEFQDYLSARITPGSATRAPWRAGRSRWPG